MWCALAQRNFTSLFDARPLRTEKCTRAVLTLTRTPLRMAAAAVPERQPGGAVRLGWLH